MSISFLGQNIEIQLGAGGLVRGKIISIDASSGSLSIMRSEGNSIVVTRSEIANLKMLPAETVAPKPAIPQTSQFQDPAILSYTNKGMEKMSLQSISPSPLPIPRAPAAMLATNSDAGKPQKQAKVKAKKNGGIDYNVGTSSRTQTEDETEYEVARNEKKNHLKNKKKVQQQMGMSGGQSDLDEDFDFDKALKSFDKRKIWQEIKTKDQTDPKMLLVSHNRLKDSSNSEESKGRFNGRSAQDKLGLREPVLSPSPTASHSSLSPIEDNVAVKVEAREETRSQKNKTSNAEVELQRVRGNALQKEMENGKLKDEIRRLTEKVRVLEALGGVELDMHTEDFDGYNWKGVIYESLSSHAESKRSNLKPAQGSLTFSLKTFQGEASKLRYLGVVQEMSDPLVLERLPPQYRKEMGLKAESAPVFMRRIKEAMQTK